MRWNPLQISLDTLVANSHLLGHELDSRGFIGKAQDERLATRLAFTAATPLRSPAQCELFCAAPLDWLVSNECGRRQFHLLDLNGADTGGLTHLSDRAMCEVLESLAETCSLIDDPDGVVVVAVSGKESEASTRPNRSMHEKLLVVEAIRHGLARRFGHCQATSLPILRRDATGAGRAWPSVALGYGNELLDELAVEFDGSVWLHGRRVIAAVNDHFCGNLLARFDQRVDLAQLRTINRSFAAGSDQSIAYGLMNEYTAAHHDPWLPAEVRHAHAADRRALIESVLDWLAYGRQAVIKPRGTGPGHGTEFFLDAHESKDSVVARIDRSLALTAQYYGLPGGALPYTICEYLDGCRVRAKAHPLDGHKFELRIVVYRHGMMLRAFPAIAKIARQRDDGGERRVRRALANNTTAGDTAPSHGADFLLPLANERTLELLDLTFEEIEDLCGTATGYMRHVLDQVEDQPERFGLPARLRSITAPPLFAAA